MALPLPLFYCHFPTPIGFIVVPKIIIPKLYFSVLIHALSCYRKSISAKSLSTWMLHSKVAFKKTDNLIQFRSVPTLNPDVIRNFFSLQVDHKSINESLPDDRFTKYLVKKYSGIRILQQDTWECAMAYIISSSLNINVINKILDRISLLFTGDSRGRLPRPHELQMIKRPLNNFLGKKWDYLSILSKQIVEGTFK